MPAVAPPPDALLLTPREAARLLSISTRTLWSMSDRGEIPVVRIGRSVRYYRAALVEWIANAQPKNAAT